MFQEFKPALIFLGKFLLIYLVGNIIYGIYVESFGQRADAITAWVTAQSAAVLQWMDHDATTRMNPERPTVFLQENDQVIISVFEGCNGINVIIVFVAFVFAFTGSVKRMIWFLPTGILVIHFFNLLRIMLLYYTAIYQQRYFYYLHKYFFTAILYLVVFALWAAWIKLNVRSTKQPAQ